MRIWPLLLIPSVYTLNVLVHFTAIGKSHLGFANALIDTLIDRRHTVDVLVGLLNTIVKTTKLSKRVNRTYVYKFRGESPWMSVSHLENPFEPYEAGSADDFFFDTELELCKEAVTSAELRAWLLAVRYDAGLSSDFSHCGAALFHAHHIPSTALFLPTPLMSFSQVQMGIPAPPGYVVDWLEGKDKAPTTFFERFDNLLGTIRLNTVLMPTCAAKSSALFRSAYGASFPSPPDLYAKFPLLFVNGNELLDPPRPISNKIKYIGGIGLGLAKPLSSEFEQLLDRASKGNVIFSFGTQVPTERTPLAVRQAFLKAFSHFPEYNFLWKYDTFRGDLLDFSNSSNVFPISWLPQTDLLRDKRVKLFISHMGMNSLLEGTHSGVPFLSVPIFADQYHNTMMAKKRGIAVQIDKLSISEASVTAAIRELLGNDKYRESAARLAGMLASKPAQPRKSFVEWVEFAAAYPTLSEHFELASTKMSVVEEYCLDCFAVIALFLLISVWLAARLLTFALSTVRNTTIKKKVL